MHIFIIPNDNYLNYIYYIYQDKHELNLASRVSTDWGRGSGLCIFWSIWDQSGEAIGSETVCEGPPGPGWVLQ